MLKEEDANNSAYVCHNRELAVILWEKLYSRCG